MAFSSYRDPRHTELGPTLLTPSYLITSENTLFPNKITITGTRGQDFNMFLRTQFSNGLSTTGGLGSCTPGKTHKHGTSPTSESEKDRAAEIGRFDGLWSTHLGGLGLTWSWRRQPTAGAPRSYEVYPTAPRPHLLAPVPASYHEEK